MSETIYMETQVNSMVRILEGRIRIDSQWQRMDHVIQIFNSVQFSRSVLSNSLQPHESQHARPPCPWPSPGVHSNSCLLSWWCHPAISSPVIPFSSCPQSLLASESFPMSQLFTWGGQSIGVSTLTSVFPMNTQDWSPLEWTSWISWQSKAILVKFGWIPSSFDYIFVF